MYLASHTPTAGELFTIWAGANNLLDRQSDQSRPCRPRTSRTRSPRWPHAGAKQFLIPNLPLLGEIPASSGFPAAQRQALDAWSVGFNQTLQAEATVLSEEPGSPDPRR